MSLDVDGDSGDSDSVIDFAQAEARKKSKATSASATCARKRPHPGAEWKKEFPSLQWPQCIILPEPKQPAPHLISVLVKHMKCHAFSLAIDELRSVLSVRIAECLEDYDQLRTWQGSKRGAHTGSQAVGRGRAVSRGAHTGSQAVGRGRAVSRGAHTGSQAVSGEYTGSQAVGRGRATRGRDQVRAQRHSATVEELPNEREENIDEDESDIEIEENPLPPHREDVTHVFVHDVGWKKNV
eukprot:Em0012g211a